MIVRNVILIVLSLCSLSSRLYGQYYHEIFKFTDVFNYKLTTEEGKTEDIVIHHNPETENFMYSLLS